MGAGTSLSAENLPALHFTTPPGSLMIPPTGRVSHQRIGAAIDNPFQS